MKTKVKKTKVAPVVAEEPAKLKKVKKTKQEPAVEPVKQTKKAVEPKEVPAVKKAKQNKVKFAEVPKEEAKVTEKKPETEISTEGDETAKGKKRRRNRNDKNAKSEKRLKLMEGVLGPAVETVDFEPDHKKFTEFELDDRILKVVGEMGWKCPTQVQESVIALALEGKNIMARARTGSGKTAAFLLPVLQKLIQHLNASSDAQGPFALVIAPTKELATQIFKLLVKLLAPLPFLQALNLSELADDESSVWENDRPSIVVSTPGKIIKMLNLRSDFCKSIRHLVLDEADLLLSYGYDSEMTSLKEHLPGDYQCIFTSATLSDDMTFLKKIFMTGPVVTIKLKEGDLPAADQLSQYHVLCENDEQRFTIMVSMVKLKLIVGKTIVFVNSTDRSYKLSLVLRTFGVKSCILNSEMPANNRCHVINQFNDGLFNIIIASDAQDLLAPTGEEPKAKKSKAPRDKEAGVARGIDFHHVSNVINFDFPISTDIYIHRVGRTARGWNKGTALSFCDPEERPLLDVVQAEINKQMGRDVLMPYEIRIKELDSFILRTREALNKCKKNTIKFARMRDIKLELLRSQKLEGYFTSNPREKELLARNEQPISLKLHSTGIADVPEYMVPKALRGMDFSTPANKNKRHRKKKHLSANQKKFQKKKNDPLQSFKA